MNTKQRRIIREPRVRELVDISSSTLRRLVKAGNFPEPVVIGPNMKGWYEDEVNQHINSLPRGKAPSPQANTARKKSAKRK